MTLESPNRSSSPSSQLFQHADTQNDATNTPSQADLPPPLLESSPRDQSPQRSTSFHELDGLPEDQVEKLAAVTLELKPSDNEEGPDKLNLAPLSDHHPHTAPHIEAHEMEDYTLQETAFPSPWDPLQEHSRRSSKELNQDLTVVVEEGDVADEHLDDIEDLDLSDTKHKPSTKRTSHLRLDLKPPSPQPWDLIDPPNENGHTGDGPFYASVRSRKTNVAQSNTPVRSLIPKSSYYFGPPPSDSAYGTHPIGQIGFHHPREVLRIERDYTGGELIQFAPIYPLELEGRITPTQFLESINSMNEILISAHSLRHSMVDNMLTIFTLQASKLFVTSHFDKEMQRLRHLIDDLNSGLYNSAGLNILWPGKVAFLFLEVEYY